MKTALSTCLLLLMTLALPATVNAYGCPLFPCVSFPHPARLGPWYLYFPYEAHFQAPAPVGPFPNWQVGVQVPAGPATYAPPARAPWQPPAPQPLVQPSGYIQPAGYSYPQAPSYWYGNR
jgi:hypothetical protein